MSKHRHEASQNSGDNVFKGLSVGPEENGLVLAYLASHDLAPNSRRAIRNDLRKFAGWFSHANREPFVVKRITVRDVTDFKDHLRRAQGQAVAMVIAKPPPRSHDERRRPSSVSFTACALSNALKEICLT